MINPITLAAVALEVGVYMPDDWKFVHRPRAEWRGEVIEKAIKIVNLCNITEESEDIDEIVTNYFSHEEALS